jgi:cell division protein FtsW
MPGSATRAPRTPRPAAAQSPAGPLPWLHRPLMSQWLLVGVTVALLAIGTIMVLSTQSVTAAASPNSSLLSAFSLQLALTAGGLVVFAIAAVVPIPVYRTLAVVALVGAVLALLAVPFVGTVVRGSRRWIALPMGQQFQPSEIVKFGLALWGADLLARKERYKLLFQTRHVFIPLVPVTVMVVALVMMEPDMGTSLTIMVIALALLWVAGLPGRWFGAMMVVVTFLVTVLAVLSPYRLERLVSFTDPFKQSGDTGYQAVQGLYALASGGLFGVGLGSSREKWSWLPNADTDYIFAIIGEELGLIGTLLTVLLFGILAYAGLRVASRSTDAFARYAATGVTAWIIGQAVLNMGYVSGVLPVTGVPLPLISSGGTSLLTVMAALGFLVALARNEPEAAGAIAARPPGWWRRVLSPAPGPRAVAPRTRLAPPRGSVVGAGRGLSARRTRSARATGRRSRVSTRRGRP